MKYDAFISYNKAQKAWVRRLVARLRKAGINPFFDEEVGLAGTALARAIAEGIIQSRCYVIILTPESVESKWVGYEIQRALELDVDSRKRFIIPVLLKECSIPEELAPLSYIDFSRGMKPQKFEELLKAIRQRGIVELKGRGNPSHRWWWCSSPVGVDLSETWFVDASKGWVVGDAGTLLRTTDGGRTWLGQKSGTNQSLYSIAFHEDGKRGWIVGERATILETKDGGENWNRLKTNLKADFFAVSLCNNYQDVCIVGGGGVILKRELTQKRWKQIPSLVTDTLWSLHFSWRGELGCAVGGNGAILISLDGGNTWRHKKVGVKSSLYSATVLADERTIWVVGDEGTVLVSKNKGKTWDHKPYSASSWKNWLNAADFSPDGRTGWIAGSKGLLLNTIDGGNTWSSFCIEDTQDLVNVVYEDNKTVWIVGDGGALITTKQI
jgi:photosystem II stability/assembly factor-like uncharacterized protein